MRKYYNPALTAEEADALDWENYAMLAVGNALLGAVDRNLLAVMVRATFERSVAVDLVFDAPSEFDDEVAEDVMADLDHSFSHLDVAIDIVVKGVVEPDYFSRLDPSHPGRLVYSRSSRQASSQDVSSDT